MNPILMSAMTGGLGALLIDLKNFAAARKKNRRAQFDVVLCIVNVAIGGISGSGLGAGLTVMAGGQL